VEVCWDRLFKAEPLLSCPPASLTEDLGIAGYLVQKLDLLRVLRS
jgi:hypothetical protein